MDEEEKFSVGPADSPFASNRNGSWADELVEQMSSKIRYEEKREKKYKDIEAESADDSLEVIDVSTVKPEKIRWLWEKRLAKGKLTVFSGKPGLGKSQATIYIAGVVSNGGEFPDGEKTEKGSVLIISSEDDVGDTIAPRLHAVGADTTKIKCLRMVLKKNGTKTMFNLETHTKLLKKVCLEMEDLRLIIVDPMSSFMGNKDANSVGQVRGLLDGLRDIAFEKQCSVVFVMHENKGENSDALNKIAGSHAFGAAARMGFSFCADPEADEDDDNARKLMVSLKSNLSKEAESLAYQIKPEMVDGEIPTSRVEWLGTSTITKRNLNKKISAGRPNDLFLQCKEELGELLRGKNKVSGEEVIALTSQLSEYKSHMLKKARESLGFRATSNGYVTTWEREEGVEDF